MQQDFDMETYQKFLEFQKFLKMEEMLKNSERESFKSFSNAKGRDSQAKNRRHLNEHGDLENLDDYQDSFSASKLQAGDNEGLRVSAHSFQPKAGGRGSKHADQDPYAVLEQAISLLAISDDGKQMSIIKQIIDRLSAEQREELLSYINANGDGPIKHSDVEEYKRVISNHQAELQKLSKVNSK